MSISQGSCAANIGYTPCGDCPDCNESKLLEPNPYLQFEELVIDEKWSVLYNTKDNDKPMFWTRLGIIHSEPKFNNPGLAMFHALLAKGEKDET